MRIIAFINDACTVEKILDHIGEPTQPPHVAPARGPPLWEAAAAAEQAKNDPQRDWSAHCAPEIEFDQRGLNLVACNVLPGQRHAFLHCR